MTPGWDDFLTQSVCLDVIRGFTDITRPWLNQHVTRHAVGRIVNACPFNTATLRLGVYQGSYDTNQAPPPPGGVIATAWSQVLSGNNVVTFSMTPGAGCLPGINTAGASEFYNGTWSEGTIQAMMAYLTEFTGLSGGGAARAFMDTVDSSTPALWTGGIQFYTRPNG